MTNILGVVILVNCGQMDGRHVAISTLDRRVLKNTNLKHVIRTLEWPAICCISPVKGNHNDRSHLPHIFNICFWRIGHFTLLLAKSPWAMSNPRVYGLSLIASVSSLSSIKQIFFFLQAFCQTSISVYFHHKTWVFDRVPGKTSGDSRKSFAFIKNEFRWQCSMGFRNS